MAASVAAILKARVTLVEAGAMGGDCLNTGCVPSKALLRSAQLAHQARHAARYGLQAAELAQDFAAVMERVQRVVRSIEPHDAPERFRALGVDVVHGRARLTTPWTVRVEAGGDAFELTTRSIVIATGSRPRLPAIPGLREAGCLTTDTLWSLRRQPRHLLVLGGGPVGCELAQAFARLNVRVTLVEQGERLLPRDDADAAGWVAEALAADGVTVLAGHRALRCEAAVDGHRLTLEHDGARRSVEGDVLLCATGRTPYTDGLGLEALGIRLADGGAVPVDAALRVRWPHLFACGDVTGRLPFTHMASHQGRTAAINALLAPFKRFAVDERAIPWVTFTDPQLAQLGLTQAEARQRGVPHEVTHYRLAELDRALTDEATAGFVKLLTAPGSDRLLGATLVGEQAGELLPELVLAMQQRLGLKKILAAVHAYPTLAEANRYAAAEWQLAHLPPRLLGWAERLHRWRRGPGGAAAASAAAEVR